MRDGAVNPELDPRESSRMTRAAVRYRDGRVALMVVLRDEATSLRRAGFLAHHMRLRRDDGSVLEADFWTQERPRLSDYLNAAFLLFGDEPGSLSWQPNDAHDEGAAGSRE
jgi:hypothetical protein